MCRLLFINKKVNKELIYKFLKQSISKKFTPDGNGNCLDNPRDHDLHLDGFGFVWKQNDKYHLYKNSIRPQLDFNLKTIINLIDSNYFIGHLRATKNNMCTPINYHSTHPFHYNQFYFCHNGCVENFKNNKKIILNAINMKYYNNIKGCCDSEFLFYLFLSIFDITKNKNEYNEYNEYNTIKLTCQKFFNFLNLLSGTISANIIINYNNITVISRFISNKELEPPSLYHNKEYSVISSEPVDNNNFLVKKNTIIYFNNDKTIIEELY